MLEDEFRRRGLSEQEAKIAARRKFGPPERAWADCLAAEGDDLRGRLDLDGNARFDREPIYAHWRICPGENTG